MRIYLDNCCFNRPFDLQDQDIIVMESEAILAIINRCTKSGNWLFFSSDILDDEMDNIVDPVKKQKVLSLYRFAEEHIELNTAVLRRALNLQSFNFGSYDALHLASAENGRADIFLTTDKKLIKQAQKANLRIEVFNPLIWLSGVVL
ncbi:MAG: hypothetical protein LBU89_12685 [Fibromonadaceae bacterium]|jgi:predicted nucleic acid-binding protein|nr:hypothetical protein [Fibromonadaceae bacterium]